MSDFTGILLNSDAKLNEEMNCTGTQAHASFQNSIMLAVLLHHFKEKYSHTDLRHEIL